MTADPFVHPTDDSASDAIAAIGEDFDVLGEWDDRFRHIIDLGRHLPPYPEQWCDDAHRVQGCQSKVWMAADSKDGRLYFAGTSDAHIVAGLIALLLRVYSGRPPAEIIATDPVFLKNLGLIGALHTSRGNGIAAMTRRIQDMAALEAARG